MIYICDDDKKYFSEFKTMADFFAIDGEVFKRKANRHTLRFGLEDQWYFIKCHSGVGWGEIFKNLLRLKLPVIDARTEWQAIKRLQDIGVDTLVPVGFGVEGLNPGRRQSFLITRDIGKSVSLETLCGRWPTNKPSPILKRALIDEVATIARRLHENGVNHRDLYLCHFLLRSVTEEADYSRAPENLRICLIDLHRVQLRSRTPERWIVKDLGSLYFSSMDIGLTTRDLFRFMKTYSDKPLRSVIAGESGFWEKVRSRAESLYKDHLPANAEG